jgi:hypothetical protein
MRERRDPSPACLENVRGRLWASGENIAISVDQVPYVSCTGGEVDDSERFERVSG